MAVIDDYDSLTEEERARIRDSRASSEPDEYPSQPVLSSRQTNSAVRRGGREFRRLEEQRIEAERKELERQTDAMYEIVAHGQIREFENQATAADREAARIRAERNNWYYNEYQKGLAQLQGQMASTSSRDSNYAALKEQLEKYKADGEAKYGEFNAQIAEQEKVASDARKQADKVDPSSSRWRRENQRMVEEGRDYVSEWNEIQSQQSQSQSQGQNQAQGQGGQGQMTGQSQEEEQAAAEAAGLEEQTQAQEGDQAQAQEGDQAQAQEGEAQEGEGEGEEGAEKPQGSGFMKAFGNAVGSYFGNAASQRIAKSGVDPSGVSASDRRIAELREQNAQNLDKASQQSLQIANRNYRDEAEKNAAAQAAQENQQKVANMGNASAGAAALNRGTAQADYDTHMQRSDTQREKGYNYLDAADAARQSAEQARAEAKVKDYRYGDMSQRNRESDFLSEGPTPEDEPKPDGGGEPPTENPPDPVVEEDPPVPNEENQVDMQNVNVQQVINYLQGRQPAAPAEEVNAVIQKYIQETGADPSVAESLAQPIPRDQSLSFGDDTGLLNEEYKKRSGGAEFMAWLTQWQNRGDNEELDAANRGAEIEAPVRGEGDLEEEESGGGTGPGSDSRIKNVRRGVNVGNIAQMLYEMSGPGR